MSFKIKIPKAIPSKTLQRLNMYNTKPPPDML